MKSDWNTQKAEEAYQLMQKNIKIAMRNIEIGLADHNKQTHDWSHEGDLEEILKTLADLSDRLNGTGEYAKIPTYKSFNANGDPIRVTIPE